ncbi:hypothetical protein D3C81_1648260 [compost metagenome]
MASATTGQQRVVANPDIRVMPVIARPDRSPYSAARVASKASNKPNAMPTPMTIQAQRNIGSEVEPAISSSPLARTRPLLARILRPPKRAMSRLARGANNALTRMLSDSAP